ncbi:hypothetical protein N9W89_13350 [Hellea sp.]|nr:hypothetical protein [Hellea sp.]
MPHENILHWSATIAGIIAAIMVVSIISSKMAGLGFVVFSLSSILWIKFRVLAKESPLTIQYAALMVVNIIGTYLWLMLPSLGGKAPDSLSA